MSDDRADAKEAAIEIPLNKVAVASFVVFAVFMTAAGIWMIIVASSLVFWAIGVIGGVFFGCFTVLAVARLWDSLPGLTIDSLGISTVRVWSMPDASSGTRYFRSGRLVCTVRRCLYSCCATTRPSAHGSAGLLGLASPSIPGLQAGRSPCHRNCSKLTPRVSPIFS